MIRIRKSKNILYGFIINEGVFVVLKGEINIDYKNNLQSTNTQSLEELKKQNFYSICTLIVIIGLFILLVSCALGGSSDDKERCAACNGTGYVNSKYCPICDGEGEVDSETNDHYYDTINKYGMRQ